MTPDLQRNERMHFMLEVLLGALLFVLTVFLIVATARIANAAPQCLTKQDVILGEHIPWR